MVRQAFVVNIFDFLLRTNFAETISGTSGSMLGYCRAVKPRLEGPVGTWACLGMSIIAHIIVQKEMLS